MVTSFHRGLYDVGVGVCVWGSLTAESLGKHCPSQVIKGNSSGKVLLAVCTTDVERVTGRKARRPQMEEIGCTCQTFFPS